MHEKNFFYLLVSFICVGIAFDLLTTWRGVSLLRPPYSFEALFERALRWTPSNPDPYYTLSLFHHWNFESKDPRKALHYIHRAIERNPFEQMYWIHLAKIHKHLGETGAFEQALEGAILVNPTSYQGRWVVGNLLLQGEDVPKALVHFSYLLRHYPEESSLVYDVWSKVAEDPNFVLEKLVSEDPSSLKSYLSYLYEQNDTRMAKKVWQKRVSLGHKADRNETRRHIDFLLSRNEFSQAMEVWKAWLQEQGVPLSTDGNAITNGSFEMGEILGGGFDWKISDVKGAKVDIDRSVAFEGKNSLRITFDGRENVDFYHVQQTVLLKPDTDYSLKAYIKTEGVTTKSGLKMEVYGMGPAFYGCSESMVGDHPWKEISATFRTTPQSEAAVVRVRRERTNKFDRLISGTVWLDHIRLTEIKR